MNHIRKGKEKVPIPGIRAVTHLEPLPVKVLGSGCAKCNQLKKAVKAVLAQLGLQKAGG